MDGGRSLIRRLSDESCTVRINPTVKLPQNPQLTSDSANAWYTIVENTYIVKATYLDHNADAIETDAVTAAIIDVLRTKNPKLRESCKYFMQYEGSFIGYIRRANTGMYLTPTRNERATKCVVTRFITGSSLLSFLQTSSKHTIRRVINGLSRTLHAMLVMGYYTGFVHNDAHMGNLLYDPAAQAFVVIDYGKCVFDPNRIERVLPQDTIATVIRKECCALGDRTPPARLSDFYRRYKGFEQKFPVTAMGKRTTRKFAIMNDIASFSFMTWYWVIDRRLYQAPVTSPAYTTNGVIAFSNDGAAFKIPTKPGKIVECAVQLRKSNSIFAPIATGLAWMAMYILSYFEAKDGGRDYLREAVEFQLADVMGDVETHPLYNSGQTTAHGFRVSENAFNKNLQTSKFIATMLSVRDNKKRSHR